MNWQPTPDELREVEREHFRQTGQRGIVKARAAHAAAFGTKGETR